MHVLVVEDKRSLAQHLGRALEDEGYSVTLAYDGDEALRLGKTDDYDVMILDVMLPRMDGFTVIRKLRECRLRIQAIIVSARDSMGDVVHGLDAGADDYLTKPFIAQELRVRLRAGRRILDLQEELLLAREALRDQATHDGMTGLLNRGAVLETLRNEVERASREGHPLSLLIADFDHFKAVNDTYGHLAGDAVLREGARRMKSAIRRYDALGRYGGEEFLVVLPGCDPVSATAQATRLCQAMSAEPFSVGGVPLRVTCSVGVSSRIHPEITHVDALIREADMALYAAKRRGRDRVEACVPESLDLAAPAVA
jgi:diguanylate cyclase (GGDEF)-like protein